MKCFNSSLKQEARDADAIAGASTTLGALSTRRKKLYPSRIYALLFLGLIFSLCLPSPTVMGLSDDQKKLFNSGVLNFDIATGEATNAACGGSADQAISGSNNAEIIWNYFTGNRGMTPIATAGIMGNFNQESHFDPAIKQNNTTRAIPDGGDGKTGFGIAQWTSQGRQAALFAKLREVNLGKYYGAGFGHPEIDKSIPAEDLTNLLTVELDYAWDGDSSKISDIANQLNAATSPSGDTGSTVLFHKLFERSGDNASQIQERVSDASGFLKQFGGVAGTASCAGELGGVLTMDDAIPWAMKFINDTKAKYNPGGRNLENDRTDTRINLYVTNDGVVGNGGGCWGGLYCGQCTALTGWFVSTMTDYTYRGGNGGVVVGNLGSKGVATGSEPRPFSIFSYDTSSVGHTGIVLGTLETGEVITLENNLSSNTLAILKYDIKKSHSDVRFAYVGDKLKVSGINPTP